MMRAPGAILRLSGDHLIKGNPDRCFPFMDRHLVVVT